MAAFVFRIGDTVYVDGQRYSWEEWKKLRESDRRETVVPAADVSSVRAASCVTPIYYAEFPSDDERFECSGGLGALTRDEIVRRGWRVDYVEKLPAQADGVQLYKYKLIISR